MYLTTDLGDFVARLKGFRYPSGERFEYRSVDTLVLAKVLTRATGMSLAEYLEAKIWNPLGAVDDASWSVDSRDHSVEKAFCCLNATARDFARLGILYLGRGAIGGGDRIVSESWAIAPAMTHNRSSAMTYHDGWWILPDNERDGDFAAIGIYGQYVYVNPRTQTTIVKLSEHALQKDEIETLLTLRYIADAASGTQKDQM